MTDQPSGSGYDIIGDIHGCANTLKLLLEKMDYQCVDGVYRHATRKAVFLGDIIDRGPRIREALQLVKAMVDAGEASMVMGNHEYNALCYCTPDASSEGPSEGSKYLRDHSPRHHHLIQDTLEQFADYPDEWQEYLDWFLALPLFLEFEHFRVVHACWDADLISQYHQTYNSNRLNAGQLQESVNKQTLVGKVMDRLTRGIDIRLPDELSVTGKDGLVRHFFRANFWMQHPVTYNDVVFQPDPLPLAIAHRPMNTQEKAKLFYYDEQQKPLFIGHYWRSGVPNSLTANISCLDYSAVKYGKLVAYRMDGEKVLDNAKFVWVNVEPQEPGLAEWESDADD